MKGKVIVDIPKSCSECKMEYDQCFCIVTGESFMWDKDGNSRDMDWCEERLPNCPIQHESNQKEESELNTPNKEEQKCVFVKCLPGEHVYYIDKNKICEDEVISIEITEEDTVYEILGGYLMDGEIFGDQDFGSELFLSKEEAEQYLKQMKQNKQNNNAWL